MRSTSLCTLSGVLLIGIALGCSKEPSLQGRSESGDGRLVVDSSSPSRDPVQQKRAEFLNRIRAADPNKETVERALLNERNELGLIVNRKTNLDDLPKLSRAMLAQLDQSFPGQDQTVVIYTPTEPPRKIGTARLDARTRDMTYQPAQP